MESKICTKCKKLKNILFFHKKGNNRRCSMCKICRNAYNREIRSSEDYKEYRRKYQRAHPEQWKEYQRKYLSTHDQKHRTEYQREYGRKYRELHREELREYKRNWKRNNMKTLPDLNTELEKIEKKLSEFMEFISKADGSEKTHKIICNDIVILKKMREEILKQMKEGEKK